MKNKMTVKQLKEKLENALVAQIQSQEYFKKEAREIDIYREWMYEAETKIQTIDAILQAIAGIDEPLNKIIEGK